MENHHSPLIYSKRNNCPDCIYYGSYFVANKEGIIKSFGQAPDTICFMRSLAKPLQASIVFDFDIEFKPEEYAIFSGSHSGSKNHIELLKSIMKKYSINEDDLLLEAIEPLDKRGFSGETTKLHNNCSGKHLLMAIMTKYPNFPHNYLDPKHPLQEIIKKKQEELSEYKSDILSFDGCGTPLWGLPYQNIIKAYFNLFKDIKYKPLIEGILNHPGYFGGYKRQDSDIIERSQKTLFSKVGAGGLILVYNIKEEKIVLLKMSQDNNPQRELVIYKILGDLGWLDYDLDTNIYNQKNEIVAKYSFEF